jgi:C4-dicarboxylate-specific signal transduction histidine kinase
MRVNAAWLCLLFVFAWPCAARAQAELSIGVLAFRGEQDAIERWTPTAEYLSASIDDYSFRIVPLTLEGMLGHVEQDRLDFILTNTGNYVVLENAFGISRLATLKVRHLGRDFTQFGAVIFTRSDHPGLKQLEDVAGKRMMAVSERAFGGFQMAWRELIDAGIDPFTDLEELRFGGFPQDDIVHAVLAGEVDVGTVRSGTLERMAEDGLIDIDRIRLLGARESEDFPYLLSTRLYPEWPFAKARKTDERLAQRVAIALLELGPRNDAAASAFAAGWTIPLDYGPVHELFRELEIEPYAYLGKPSLESIWREYKGWILFSLAMLLLLCGLLVLIGRANRRISLSESRYREEAQQRKQAQELLARHKQELELRVEERTSELAEVNSSLRRSEATLRAIHDTTADPDLGFDAKLQALLREGCGFFGMEYALVTRAAGDYIYRADKAGNSDADYIGLVREYLLREAGRDRCPIAIADFGAYAPREDGLQSRELSGSAVATEYQVDDQVAGMLLFGNRAPSPRAFSDVDIDILQLMAQWLGGETERVEINRRAQENQAHLAHVARLNTMGEMATGIAHELNQPLTAILNYSGGILRRLQKQGNDDSELEEVIAKIGNDARRAAGIIKSLREFIKRGEHRHERFALRDCIGSAVELLRPRLQQQGIEVNIVYGREVGDIVADLIQIEQVVVNLLLNAIDALQASDASPRKIDIDISSGGGGINVAVSDNGKGLPADVVEQLFEPFFSTKREGMGMGLSISRSIVEAHGGTIKYLVNEMQQPTFRFNLPLK